MSNKEERGLVKSSSPSSSSEVVPSDPSGEQSLTVLNETLESIGKAIERQNLLRIEQLTETRETLSQTKKIRLDIMVMGERVRAQAEGFKAFANSAENRGNKQLQETVKALDDITASHRVYLGNELAGPAPVWFRKLAIHLANTSWPAVRHVVFWSVLGACAWLAALVSAIKLYLETR